MLPRGEFGAAPSSTRSIEKVAGCFHAQEKTKIHAIESKLSLTPAFLG